MIPSSAQPSNDFFRTFQRILFDYPFIPSIIFLYTFPYIRRFLYRYKKVLTLLLQKIDIDFIISKRWSWPRIPIPIAKFVQLCRTSCFLPDATDGFPERLFRRMVWKNQPKSAKAHWLYLLSFWSNTITESEEKIIREGISGFFNGHFLPRQTRLFHHIWNLAGEKNGNSWFSWESSHTKINSPNVEAL